VVQNGLISLLHPQCLPLAQCAFHHHSMPLDMAPHPLAILSEAETNLARDVVIAEHPNTVIDFREIYLSEPPKDQLREFLALEHAGRLSPTTPRPPRLATCQYDVIGADRIPSFHESVVDVVARKRVKHNIVGKQHHAALTLCVEVHVS
jgi:primary-amine oxidase